MEGRWIEEDVTKEEEGNVFGVGGRCVSKYLQRKQKQKKTRRNE